MKKILKIIQPFFLGYFFYIATCLFAYSKIYDVIKLTWSERKEHPIFAIGFFSAAPITVSVLMYILIHY